MLANKKEKTALLNIGSEFFGKVGKNMEEEARELELCFRDLLKSESGAFFYELFTVQKAFQCCDDPLVLVWIDRRFVRQ